MNKTTKANEASNITKNIIKTNIVKKSNNSKSTKLKIIKVAYKKKDNRLFKPNELIKLFNDTKEEYKKEYSNTNNILNFKICGISTRRQTMVSAQYIDINVKDIQNIKELENYFDDMDWYTNSNKIEIDDIGEAIKHFKQINFDIYIEPRFREANPGDGNKCDDNMCFYHCLEEYGVIEKYKNFTNQYGIKHYKRTFKEIINNINKFSAHKLAEDGTVNIEDIKYFENYFKINIYINGLTTSLRKLEFKNNIYLKFCNNHYELDLENHKKNTKKNLFDKIYNTFKNLGDKGLKNNFKNCIQRGSYIAKGVKRLVIYKPAERFDQNKIYYYDNLGFHGILNNYTNKRENIFKNSFVVRFNKDIAYASKVKNNNNMSLEEKLKYVYDNYKNEIENIKNFTQKTISDKLFIRGKNLLEYDSLKSFLIINLNNHIMKYFKDLKIDNVEDFNEYKWLRYGSCGAINWVKNNNYIYNEIYQYDVKSAYPDCLTDDKFKFPIKQGLFSYKDPKYFIKDVKSRKLKYGIYHCVISNNDNNNNCIFKFNDKLIKDKHGFIKEPNYYTHYDIYLADELGLNMELIDEKNNCLVYDANKCLIESKVIFKNFYQDLIYLRNKLKDENKPNNLLKTMISSLHGYLSETNKGYGRYYSNISNSSTQILELEDDEEFIENKYFGNVKGKKNNELDYACVLNKNDLVYNKLFRHHPFLLSYQKYKLYTKYIKMINEHYPDCEIVKIKTDGLYMTKTIKEFDDNLHNYFIGDLMPEEIYYKDVQFPNLIKIQSKETKFRNLNNNKDIFNDF